MGVNANSFFIVFPFIKRLKRWIYCKKGNLDSPNETRMRHKSVGEIETSTGFQKTRIISSSMRKEIADYQQTHPIQIKQKNGNNQQKKAPKNTPPSQNGNKKLTPPADVLSSHEFFAKSWYNFKFDRKAIWDSMN